MSGTENYTESRETIPVITYTLISANVIAFLLVFSLPEKGIENAFSLLSFSGNAGLWTWLTSLFLHVSASHLFFNMLGLYFFGRTLENEIDRQWFLAIYFLSGIIGNFAFMLTSSQPVVGASGCVFGVMGAAMLIKPLKRIHLYLFPLPLSVVALTFVIVESFIVFFRPENLPAEARNVANVAHIGGAITGAVFAFFYDPKRSAKGVLMLILSLAILLIFGSVIGLIASISSFVFGIVERAIGLVLYGLAKLISPLWG